MNPQPKNILRIVRSDDDLKSINILNQYSLEVIILYTLGSVFNCIQERPAVRVATLVEQLDSITMLD